MLMISPLPPPPFLIGHLPVPVQIPGVEGGFIRVPIARVNVSVILLCNVSIISTALYCILRLTMQALVSSQERARPPKYPF